MNIFTESIDLNNCILIQTDDINLNDIQYKEPEETEVIDIINDDSKNTVFTCRFCNETFLKWITFKRHEANHKKEKKFKCDECSTSFNILTNLTLHKAIHNKNETKCPECDKVFARVASLRAHLLLHEKDESISCPECQKPFDTELQLEGHMKSHEKKKMLIEDNLKCKLCNRDFTNATEHKLHMHNHNKMKHLLFSFPHKSTGGKNRKSRTRYAHACNDCLKTFQKRSQLVRHMRVHSGEKPFQCQLCNHAFSQSNTLKIHMSKHTGVRPFKCSLCPGTFSQKGNLRVHIHRVHSIPREENAFHCTECACAFRRLSALNAHINRVHGDTPTTFDPSKGYPPNVTILNGSFSNDVHESGTNDKSGQDGFKYITLADTDVEGIVKRYYIRQRKVENVRWLRCTYCTKEFKKPSDVVRHIRTHTREKPFQCTKCGRGFAVKSTLTTHMRTHTNEKVYNCALCEKSFSSSSSLQAHIRRHTGIKKSYQCNSCPNTYNTPEQLKIHSMIHAREEQKKENIEPNAVPQVQLKDPIFITDRGSRLYCTSAKTKLLRTSKAFRAHTCQTCGSSFRRSGHLKQHLRMHSNDRPYSCPKCERTFKSSTVLNTHIKTHDGIKSFHCTECSGAFTTKGSLRRHMTRHSSRRPYMCPYCKKMFKTLQNCRKHIKSHRSEISVEICEEKRKLQQGPLVSVLKNTNVNFGEISVLDNLTFDKNIQTNSISNIIVYDPVANIHDLIQNNNANGQIICQLLTADNTISLANALNEPHPQQNVFEFNDPSKQEQLELINQEDKCHSMTITKELLTTLDPSIKNIQLPVFHHEFDPKLCTQQINLVPSSNSDNAENFEIISQEIPNMLYTQNAVTVPNDDCIYINTDEISENVPNLNTVSPVYPVDKPEINPRMTKRPNRRLRILKQRTKHKPTVEESDNKDKNHNKSESKINLNKNNFVNNIDNEYFINSSNIDNVKKYICSTCSKGFRKPSDLERHIRTHTGERPFRCEKCGKSFSLKSTLKSHMKIHSSVLKKFTCPECDCLFSTKGSLKVHIRIHTGSKPFQCPYCPMRFRTSGHRQTHCQVHLKEAERANNLNNNFKKTKKTVKPSTNNKTNFETDEINNLTSVENIQPVQTEESSNIYYTLSDNQSNAINLDMLSAFPETILENIHQPEQDASILEQLENGGLLIHDVFNNTDQSWYDVEMYESGQIINVHLTSNSKTVSDEISGELEAAIPCSVEFVQDSNNPTDVEAESSDILESSRSVQNVCYYCKKGFEKPSKLERHLRVHTGDRPFVCSVCKKAFTQMNSLNAHMRTHSGNKPFKCSYCDHSTAQKGNLNIHLMKIHGISGSQMGVLKTPILEEMEQKLNEHIQQ